MMKGKESLLMALLFAIVAVVFVRCTEDDPTDGIDTDLDINVKLEATQDGAEGGDNVVFKVSLVNSDGDAIVNNTGVSLTATAAYTGTATANDFDTELSTSVSIADGQSSTTINLQVNDDSEVEGEETITLTLSSPSVGEIEIASATAKVADNDSEGETTEYSIDVKLEQDGAEGGASVKFSIRLLDADMNPVSNASGADITVTTTYTGTADADDIEGAFATIATIAQNESSASIELTVVDDAEDEGDEAIILTISNPSTGTLKKSSETATITDNDDESQSSAADISVLASKFYHTDAVTFTFDETWVTITSNDLPDHVSVYYPESDPLYENYSKDDDADFTKNPGEIASQNLVFKVPRYPSEATSKESTPMGPMGVAINSVAIFNQFAAGDDTLEEEIKTFDQYEGHPATDTYHYHTEPVWLTQFREGADNEALVGILLDGFPLYGTHENGAEVTNADLDDYHGHFGITEDFPDGIYHYHLTSEYPYINGDGFYGTKGSITQ